MRRRNFLKGLFAAYTCASTYFSFKYFNSKDKNSFEKFSKLAQNNNLVQNKKKLSVVEIPIVYHCNLNCAHCDHFAPIAPKYTISVENFKKNLKRLSEVTESQIETIWLLGGEPLLHDKICELIKAIPVYFPDANIAMTTNGLLLDKQNDDFWQTCFECRVTIMVENYILNDKNINFDKIYDKLKRYNCNLHINPPKYEFRQAGLSKERKYNPQKRYEDCKCKLWHLFDNGKFYACPFINGVDKFFNKKFPQYAIPVAKEDVLDIHKIKSIDDIIEFYKKPKSMCAHCAKFKIVKWRLSKQEANEWYDG